MNKLNCGMVSWILKTQQAMEQHPFVAIFGFMGFLGLQLLKNLIYHSEVDMLSSAKQPDMH